MTDRRSAHLPVHAILRACPRCMNIATRLRIDSVRATTEAGSGHPSTCCSAAEIMAALFFSEMRYDPRDPENPDNDRFVLSKGHAAPILYAAWAEAGIIRARRRADAADASTRISRAIPRRGCRGWTSPPARSVRDSAPASASR